MKQMHLEEVELNKKMMESNEFTQPPTTQCGNTTATGNNTGAGQFQENIGNVDANSDSPRDDEEDIVYRPDLGAEYHATGRSYDEELTHSTTHVIDSDSIHYQDPRELYAYL
ncbi:unnamed protein product [Calypogeia fissa]